MSTKVYIPTPLRSYAGNRSEVEVSAPNVSISRRDSAMVLPLDPFDGDRRKEGFGTPLILPWTTNG